MTRPDCPAHGIVTKTVHKTLQGGVGGERGSGVGVQRLVGWGWVVDDYGGWDWWVPMGGGVGVQGVVGWRGGVSRCHLIDPLLSFGCFIFHSMLSTYVILIIWG